MSVYDPTESDWELFCADARLEALSYEEPEEMTDTDREFVLRHAVQSAPDPRDRDTPIPSTYPEIDGTEERDTIPMGPGWKPPSEAYKVPPAPRLPLEWRQPESRPATPDPDLDIEVDVVFDTIRTAQAIIDDGIPPTDRSH